MHPRLFQEKGNNEGSEEVLGKRRTGNERGASGQGLERRTDRRMIAKMHELFKRVFEVDAAKKEKWTFCEICFRFCRKGDRVEECKAEHGAWDTDVLQKTYNLKSTKEMRQFLVVIQKEQAGKDDIEEKLPYMGTRGSKKKCLSTREEVTRTVEESKESTRRDTQDGED